MQKPTYEDMYGSEYFRPEDLPRGGVRVKFIKADVRELMCTGAAKKWKVVLFAQTGDGKAIKKLIAVNKTSAKIMSTIWGKPADETYSAWLGKLADLTHVKIKAFGKLADAVLITPVTQPVGNDDSFESAAPAHAETVPVIEPGQESSGLKRPQKKAEVKQESQAATQDNIDPSTGEVFEPGSFESETEPLDDIKINDIKSTESKGETYWFIYGSDSRIYTTKNKKIAADAAMAQGEGRGVIIQHSNPLRNSKGIEYFPIETLK